MWLPFKKLRTKVLFGLSRALKKVLKKPDLFQKSTNDIDQLANHERKKEDGGWQLCIITTKIERNFEVQAPVQTLGTA